MLPSGFEVAVRFVEAFKYGASVVVVGADSVVVVGGRVGAVSLLGSTPPNVSQEPPA